MDPYRTRKLSPRTAGHGQRPYLPATKSSSRPNFPRCHPYQPFSRYLLHTYPLFQDRDGQRLSPPVPAEMLASPPVPAIQYPKE
jgi:hypothetical protein